MCLLSYQSQWKTVNVTAGPATRVDFRIESTASWSDVRDYDIMQDIEVTMPFLHFNK